MRVASNDATTAIFEGFVPIEPSVTVIVDPENFDIVNVPAERIAADTLAINYACSLTEDVQFGSVIAPDLTVELINYDGLYDRIDFVGLELRVYAEVNVTGTPENISMGRFICDTAVVQGDNIILTALGIITKMDKIYQTGDINFPITCWNFADALCSACGLELKAEEQADRVLNTTLTLQEPPGGKYTYRQLLGFACEIMAVCAQTRLVNGTEKVILRWYADTGRQLTDENLFSVNVDKNPLFLSGCKVISKGRVEPPIDDSEYVYTVKDNALADALTPGGLGYIASAITLNGGHDQMPGYDFRPRGFSAVVITNPLIEPLDAFEYVHDSVSSGYLYVGSVTWSPSLNTQCVGVGYHKKESEDPSPFTPEQDTVLDGIADEIETLKADYVTENGSDANGWTWRKWNSGMVEMWAQAITIVLDSNYQAWGSTGIYRSYGPVSLPISVNSDDVFVQVTPANGRSAAVLYTEPKHPSGDATVTEGFYVTFALPNTSQANASAYVYVKGTEAATP